MLVRRLLISASTLALAATVVCVAAAAYSYRWRVSYQEHLVRTPAGSPPTWVSVRVGVNGGRFVFDVMRGGGWYASRAVNSRQYGLTLPRTTVLPAPGWAGRQFADAGGVMSDRMFAFGAKFWRTRNTVVTAPEDWSRGWGLSLHWLTLAVPLALSSSAAIRQIVAVAKRRRRSRSNCCLCCGYDMRGSPLRCPECGAEPDKGDILLCLDPLSQIRKKTRGHTG